MTSIHECHTTCPHVIARASTTWIQSVISTMAEAMSVPYCCSENNRNLSTDTVMRILKTRRKINLCATFQLLTLKVENFISIHQKTKMPKVNISYVAFRPS